jgi:GDP-L-fucose synthase
MFITGANGFVGKSLLEAFPNAKPVPRELLYDPEKLTEFLRGAKVVFHCANAGGIAKNENHMQKMQIFASNIEMFENLLNAVAQNTKLFVFGSGAIYNKQRDLIDVTEKEIGKVKPTDDYGRSKLMQYKNAQCLERYIIIPHIFGLYGIHEDHSFKFITSSIQKNLQGKPIDINQDCVFHFLHIDDFCQICRLYVENDYSDPSRFNSFIHFNMTPTESIKLSEIAEIINDVSLKKSEIIIKKSGLNFQYTGSNKKMLSQIGNYKFKTMRDGIAELLRAIDN